MATAFPVLMATLALVVLRWLVIDPIGMPRLWWLPLPFILWVGVHMGGVAEAPGRALLHGLHIIGGAASFWIGLHVARSAGARRILNVGVGGMVLGAMIMAFYQIFIDPAWLPMGREQSIYFLKRSSGPFGNPNNFAAWLTVVLPVAIGWGVCRHRLPRRWRWFPVAVALAAVLGIGLSLSRGVGLAWYLVGLSWLLTRRTLTLKLRGLMAVGVVGLSALGGWGAYQISPEVRQRWDSFVEHGGERTRPHMWHIAAELWQERPWMGKGGGSFDALLEKHRPEGLWETPKYAHNDYLNTLMEYGVIGWVLGFGVAIGTIVWGVRRRAHQAPGKIEAG
jgi:O-antigen ligase